MGDKKPIQAHVSPTTSKLSVTGTSASSGSGASSSSPPKTTPSSIASPSPALAPTAMAWAEFYNEKTKRVENVEVPTRKIDGAEAATFSPAKKKKKTSSE